MQITFWKQRRWPRPKRLILTAYEIGEREGYEKAITWAERYGSDGVRHGIHILRANRDKADPAVWLDHVNGYLERHDVSPLALAGSPCSLIHRLISAPRKTVAEGPLISVIMCAYNAQATIEMAAQSILRQSWRPLELLIVDDCSMDGTAQIALQLAKKDTRVKVHLNATNVGPYVGRNLALGHAKGQYITCHDSDDWAHPERLERQLEFLRREQLAGTMSGMLRMQADGQFSQPISVREGWTDGWLRPAFASALFDRTAFDTHLQYWDSVRFGADSELLRRAVLVLKSRMGINPIISMICLEHEHSLTNDLQTGISKTNGLSEARKLYISEYSRWHATMYRSSTKIEFPLHNRPFKASLESLVPIDDIIGALGDSKLENAMQYAASLNSA